MAPVLLGQCVTVSLSLVMATSIHYIEIILQGAHSFSSCPYSRRICALFELRRKPARLAIILHDRFPTLHFATAASHYLFFV